MARILRRRQPKAQACTQRDSGAKDEVGVNLRGSTKLIDIWREIQTIDVIGKGSNV